MQKYTKTKVIRISETQHQTLQKMKSYKVDVGKFIRDAISEKIKKRIFGINPKTKKRILSVLKKLKKKFGRLKI